MMRPTLEPGRKHELGGHLEIRVVEIDKTWGLAFLHSGGHFKTTDFRLLHNISH